MRIRARLQSCRKIRQINRGFSRCGPQARLKYCTARSCFSAAALDANVPKFFRFPVFASFLREYKRYSPDCNLRIMQNKMPLPHISVGKEKKTQARLIKLCNSERAMIGQRPIMRSRKIPILPAASKITGLWPTTNDQTTNDGYQTKTPAPWSRRALKTKNPNSPPPSPPEPLHPHQPG